MKLKEAIRILGPNQAINTALLIAQECNINWNHGIGCVFQVIVNDLERIPGNIGGKSDDEMSVIRKWILKYESGRSSCASKRISNLPGTIADPIIEQIIGARISRLNQNDLNSITYAHRIGMSAENILGLILEEYLSVNLHPFGWHCAWGETVKSVDFVHESGRLLQIKNRSNSENSSSSAVRNGTEIEKWFRIKAHTGQFMWEGLNNICKTTHLSEQAFSDFVKATISSNPDCLAIEPQNPWV
ncbi:MAG: SinI family restriction endonuclease [Pseudomonadota bacterium]